MSIHSSLVAAWPADLATLTVASSSAQVYFGRRAQKVTRSDREVWIERLEVEERGTGAQTLRGHRYRVHIRAKTNAGGDGTGKAQTDTVEALQRTLVDAYRGSRRLRSATGMSSLVSWDATEDSADRDPEDESTLDASALLTAWCKE